MNNYSSFNFNLANIIKYPIISDKGTQLLENNKYTFIVNSSSNKETIKKALQSLFNIKIIKINTCNLPKKKKKIGKFLGWKTQYKKVIITLAKGNRINLFSDTDLFI